MASELLTVGIVHGFLYHLLLELELRIVIQLLWLPIIWEVRGNLELELYWCRTLNLGYLTLHEIAQLRMS